MNVELLIVGGVFFLIAAGGIYLLRKSKEHKNGGHRTTPAN